MAAAGEDAGQRVNIHPHSAACHASRTPKSRVSETENAVIFMVDLDEDVWRDAFRIFRTFQHTKLGAIDIDLRCVGTRPRDAA